MWLGQSASHVKEVAGEAPRRGTQGVADGMVQVNTH